MFSAEIKNSDGDLVKQVPLTAFVVASVSSLIPFIGWLAYPILYVISLALWIVSWVFALSGELRTIPLIGHYGKNIKL